MPFPWFRRPRLTFDPPRLRPRREKKFDIPADLAEIAPELRQFLGQAACVQLSSFERLSALVALVPGVTAKEAVGHAAARAFARHQNLVGELARLGAEPEREMAPYVERLERFAEVTAGHEWPERVLGAHICGGLLDDFFVALSRGVKAEGVKDLPALFAVDPADGRALDDLLRAPLAGNAQLAAQLAMWGRRLVGDTLLIARSALRLTGDAEADDPHTEPLFAGVIAAHTRRMDALGLTA
ncbi:ferritin-like fold-containing protein [Gryllotalpicola protaetiae]|uniref:ferritin-like fold-containing protein n=1 Tax=Gryllotalpicola protaetiae TaxID=2419771 RepID=UPI0013C535B4|nr:ferritin-like fold-containing protein [Gryllotalpicola protaetiae]